MSRTLTPEQYTRRVERLYDLTLRERMIGVLTQLADTFREAGFTVSGPHDLSDDEYRWYFNVDGQGLPESVDVSLELAESMAYEGETTGVNFGLSIVAYGGRILGGLTPYNYTPDVWVPVNDPHAVVARLAIIEQADAEGAVDLVTEFA